MLVCGTATGEVGPATLDAINKVLGVLLAASAKQPEAAAATSSQGASEVAQRGGSAERPPRSILRNAAERQPTSAETIEHGAAGSTYQQPSSLQRQTSGTAEMAQRRSAEQSVRLPSYAERASLERQPVSTAATLSHRQLPPPSSEPEPPRKSFLKVIDHQYQPPPPASGRSGSSELGRRDELVLGADYQQQRGRAPPHDDSRRLDTDRYAAGHAADGRYPGDVAAAGQYYGGGRSRPGGGGGGEFWHEMSAYCAEYEATVGRLDELERRRAAAAGYAAAADDPYRRRQLAGAAGAADEAAAEELERRRRYRLAALDDWREAELRHAAAPRPDDYPPSRY